MTSFQITSSAPTFPASFQIWVHLRPLPNNRFVPPGGAEKGKKKRRLWSTSLIGSGATGSVWRCHFDDDRGLYAIKVVSNREHEREFFKEFEVYLALENAYQTKTLETNITPHCYGVFKGEGYFALVLGLCEGALNTWDELNISER